MRNDRWTSAARRLTRVIIQTGSQALSAGAPARPSRWMCQADGRLRLQEMGSGYQVYDGCQQMSSITQEMSWHTIPTSPIRLHKATPRLHPLGPLSSETKEASQKAAMLHTRHRFNRHQRRRTPVNRVAFMLIRKTTREWYGMGTCCA